MAEAVERALILAVLCFLSAAASAGWAAHGGDILGLWQNEERDGIIEIYQCGEKYCGRIVWTKAPVYKADDSRGRAGQPRLDDNNPDPKLRNRPITGLQIMDGFIFDGKNEWKRGTLYDPKDGKTYRGKMSLASPGELRLRGYVLFSFIGRTTTWTRLDR